jgi:hypothetical protein
MVLVRHSIFFTVIAINGIPVSELAIQSIRLPQPSNATQNQALYTAKPCTLLVSQYLSL